MCGICGIISHKSILNDGCIDRMTEALIHRGPDDEGFIRSDKIHLGMRRLSIIDIDGGSQPLYDDSGEISLIANAEIYNYIELRSKLIDAGFTFKTKVDCEVIIYLYKQYGLHFIKYLRGMFAFVLWDRGLNRLIIARDRVGEKPLYFYENGATVFFSSELKSLLKSEVIPFELDPTAIHYYFHFHYVPEPLTPIKGVRKLPHGSYLLIDLNDWAIKQEQYWSFDDIEPIYGNPAALIKDELYEIAEKIIRADVPVGIAMSGGLDSSAIAALVARSVGGQVTSFTVGYGSESSYDERADAKAFSKLLDQDHIEFENDEQTLVEILPDLVKMQDDPIADISAYNYYTLAKKAHDSGVPVLIYGHGGDELFWGYPWTSKAVTETYRKSILSNCPDINCTDFLYLDPPDNWSLSGIYRYIKDSAGLGSTFRLVNDYKQHKLDRMIFYELSPDFNDALKHIHRFYTPGFYEAVAVKDPRDLFIIDRAKENIEVGITESLISSYLLGNGITQCDRLSMATSVEPRLPFVDYKLIELVIGLRKAQPDHLLPAKHWLKTAMKDVLPDSVLSRPKRGFTPPVRKWYRSVFKEYGELMQDGFLVNADILSRHSVNKLKKGEKPFGRTVTIGYKALVLELWCREMSKL
ncbi:MAG: asparagine synthase (glutamine-hydrolyzing) [Blastocatellales bacterium]